MSSPESAILEFDIIIDTKLSADTEAEIEKLQELKSLQEETKPGGEEETTEDLAKGLLESEEKLNSELVDALNGLDDKEINQLAQFAKNPEAAIAGGVGNILTKLLGSGSAAILGPLALAIASPFVMAEFIKALSVKGGPLNRDWKRFIEDEVEVGLSRVQQKEKELGVSQVILTQVVGFHPNNENWTYNSLYDRGSTRLARIGLSDREAGVTMIRG